MTLRSFLPVLAGLTLLAACEITSGSSQLKLVDLSTSQISLLAASSGHLQEVRFVPDGRGLIFEEPSGQEHLLRYVPSKGGTPKTLGKWGASAMAFQGAGLHPAGCALVFDTDQGVPGGYLVPLPR